MLLHSNIKAHVYKSVQHKTKGVHISFRGNVKTQQVSTTNEILLTQMFQLKMILTRKRLRQIFENFVTNWNTYNAS